MRKFAEFNKKISYNAPLIILNSFDKTYIRQLYLWHGAIIVHFDWDENKNQENIKKHGVDFVDAPSMFQEDNFLVMQDFRVDYKESRYIGFGNVYNRLMCVVYTERLPDIIRIISFRKANDREKRLYKKNIKHRLE